jgi:ABC-type uncharacterized transport system substrate-binding protein
MRAKAGEAARTTRVRHVRWPDDYGNDLVDAYRQSGIYAAKILKGAKPADLPVQQVVRVEFVINLKAAKILGLIFPSRCSVAPKR